MTLAGNGGSRRAVGRGAEAGEATTLPGEVIDGRGGVAAGGLPKGLKSANGVATAPGGLRGVDVGVAPAGTGRGAGVGVDAAGGGGAANGEKLGVTTDAAGVFVGVFSWASVVDSLADGSSSSSDDAASASTAAKVSRTVAAVGGVGTGRARSAAVTGAVAATAEAAEDEASAAAGTATAAGADAGAGACVSTESTAAGAAGAEVLVTWPPDASCNRAMQGELVCG